MGWEQGQSRYTDAETQRRTDAETQKLWRQQVRRPHRFVHVVVRVSDRTVEGVQVQSDVRGGLWRTV